VLWSRAVFVLCRHLVLIGVVISDCFHLVLSFQTVYILCSYFGKVSIWCFHFEMLLLGSGVPDCFHLLLLYNYNSISERFHVMLGVRNFFIFLLILRNVSIWCKHGRQLVVSIEMKRSVFISVLRSRNKSRKEPSHFVGGGTGPGTQCNSGSGFNFMFNIDW
jgi:hypothetical protein